MLHLRFKESTEKRLRLLLRNPDFWFKKYSDVIEFLILSENSLSDLENEVKISNSKNK